MKIGDKTDGGIYAGLVNGHHIIYSPMEYKLPVEVNWFQAVDYCKVIGMELPSIDELHLLCELYDSHSIYVPKRNYNCYWTSTEIEDTFALVVGFCDRGWDAVPKNYFNYVQPIKRIKI